MENYFILGKYTNKGVGSLKDSPARIEAARKIVEDGGGTFVSWYFTLGQYDFINHIQAPDSKTFAFIVLALGASGNADTETMKAFTEAEFTKMAESLS